MSQALGGCPGEFCYQLALESEHSPLLLTSGPVVFYFQLSSISLPGWEVEAICRLSQVPGHRSGEAAFSPIRSTQWEKASN